jgi:magnesium and cobalt exporter, CNNM family
MDADPWLGGALAVSFLLLLSTAVLSSLETAVLNARRSRLSQIGQGRRIRTAEAILDGPEHFQTSAHLAKSLCEAVLYGAAALIGLDLAILGPPAPFPTSLQDLLEEAWAGLLLGAVAAYFAVTLLGEAIPKSLAVRNPERLLVRWAGFIQVFTLLFTPVRWVTTRLGRALALSAGTDLAQASRAAHSEEEIRLLVEDSAEEGVLEEDEKEMIHSIFEFTDTVARQVMVPRIDIHSISVDVSLEDAVRMVLESGHSRLLVYEGTLDTVVGVVHAKDLLPHLATNNRNVPIRDLMREPFFVPEGKKIDELLQEFRTHKSQLAIVVDEFGGTSGLVTIEDVLEEIVGEIEDEYDVEEHPGTEVSETGEGVLVDARMTIDDVNEELGLNLPHGDYDTLGGFVFALFGRPAHAGERIAYDGIEFVAEALEGLRLIKIRVLRRAPTTEAEAAEEPVQ